MSTTSIQNHRRATVGHGWIRAFGVAGAVLAALGVWVVAVPILGLHLLIRFGNSAPQEVVVAAVAGSALLASLLGLGLLVGLERISSRGLTIWTGIAIVGLGASLSLPLVAATTKPTMLALGFMHVAAAAVLIPALRRR